MTCRELVLRQVPRTVERRFWGEGNGLVRKIEDALLQRGFLRAKGLEEHLSVVFKITKRGLCFICIVNDTEGSVETRSTLTREHMVTIGRALLEKSNGYATDSYGMVVLVTDSPMDSRQKLEEGLPFWLVNTLTRKLMIYDDQPGEFLDARQAIEDTLSTGALGAILQQLKVLYSPINIGLISINVLWFIILEIMGSTEDAFFMYQHGAMFSMTFLPKKEYWTLLTSAFMHFGVLHLFNNMITLLYVGKPVEMIMGRWKYLLIYLVSAVGSGGISMLWYLHVTKEVVVSAGASGAICGVCGALLYILLRNKEMLKQVSWMRFLIFFVLVLTNGMSDASVNSCAHVSGMLVGFVMTAILYRVRR